MRRRYTKSKLEGIPQTSGRPGRDTTRQKLIEAAGRVFAERGYQSATIREICLLAGANVAAVNYHFRDKEGLYIKVLEQMTLASNVEEVSSALEQTSSPEEILRHVIKATVRGQHGEDQPDWYARILAREFVQPTPAMSSLINKILRPVYGRVLEVVGQIIGLPPDDEKTRLCAHSIWGQTHFYFSSAPVLARLWPQLKMTPEQLDRIADHIADFSLAYLRTAGSHHGGRGLLVLERARKAK